MKFILFVLMQIGCNYSNKKSEVSNNFNKEYLDCFFQYHDTISGTKEHDKVLKDFTDTLNRWIELKLEVKTNLDETLWTLEDYIFFNKDKSKCLLLISALLSDSSEKVDFVNIIAGEVIDTSWHFYYKSYPVLYYFRENNGNKPYDRTTMVNMTIAKLCSDGYINLNDCSVNYDYIDSELWFQDWMREKHKEFLRNYRN